MVYYWKPVPFDEWRQRLQEAATRAHGRFSIVYRFYSTYNGPVRYVGRSDKPLGREEQYWHIGDYMLHALGGRVSWIDFTYFVGRNRIRAAYEEECKRYHWDEPDLNTNHPAKPKGRYWSCPVCGS